MGFAVHKVTVEHVFPYKVSFQQCFTFTLYHDGQTLGPLEAVLHRLGLMSSQSKRKVKNLNTQNIAFKLVNIGRHDKETQI